MGERVIEVRLPWPPSVNHYWAARGNARYISPQARAWQREAMAMIRQQVGRPRPFTVPVAIVLAAHPPDNRRRDLDNLLKATLDLLVAANILDDDHLVWELHVLRRDPVGRNRAYIHVRVQPL